MSLDEGKKNASFTSIELNANGSQSGRNSDAGFKTSASNAEILSSISSLKFKDPWYQHRFRITRPTLIMWACCGVLTVVVVGLIAGGVTKPCDNYSKQTDSLTNNATINFTTKSRRVTSTLKPPEIKRYSRLPRALVPVHYILNIKPDLDPKKSFFSGSVIIIIKCIVSTDNISLNAVLNDSTKTELMVLSHSVKVQTQSSKEPIDVKNKVFMQDISQYVIFLGQHLKENEQYEVSMEFRGKLASSWLNGISRGRYGTRSGKSSYFVVTLLQPARLRYVFPCFDEPDFKATFDVAIHRRPDMKTVSNTEIYQETKKDGWIVDYYKTTPVMSNYLLTIVVGDFESREVFTNRGIKVRAWSRPDVVDQLTYSLDLAKKMLEYFENYFNISYPMKKLDVIGLPNYGIFGMENWGAIYLSERAVLFNENFTKPQDQRWTGILFAHEIAHQWFGNLVTPKWWDDLWLNEGFAQMMTFLGMDAVAPEFKMGQQILYEYMSMALVMDSLTASHEILEKVDHVEDTNFDYITYYKGASVIRMMMNFLGRSTFRKGLNNYLRNKSYQNAVSDELWAFLSQQSSVDGSNIDVKSIMDVWLKQVGYPLVTVFRDYFTGRVTVKQRRFLLHPADAMIQKSVVWPVPLTYVATGRGNWDDPGMMWLNSDAGSIRGLFLNNSEMLIVNVKQGGFYRVNYDLRNWKMIIDQLNRKNHSVIPPENRAQLIDDSWNLARAGVLGQEISLRVLEYLDKEQEVGPWLAAMEVIEFLHKSLSRSAVYGMFQKFVLSLLRPLYDDLGWENRGQYAERLLRVSTVQWACFLGHEQCVDRAVKYFDDWMENSAGNSIPPIHRETVYCTAIRLGGEREWSFAWGQLNNAKDPSEQKALRNALACSREPWLINRYLLFTSDPFFIKPRYTEEIFTALAKSHTAQPLAWQYLQANWNKKGVLNSKGYFLEKVATGFSQPIELEEVQRLYTSSKENKQLSHIKKAFEETIEQIKANVKWLQRNELVMARWLRAYLRRKMPFG